MSRIDSARLVPYRLTLRAHHGDARGGFHDRSGVLLVLTDRDGREGLGDCAPLSPWSPSLEVCLPWLEREAARLPGLDPCQAWEALLAETLTSSACPGPVRAALEGAFGFLCSAQVGLPLSALFGGTSLRPAVLCVNAVIDAGELDAALQQARLAATQGYTAFKLKVGIDPSRDAILVSQLRAALGPDATIRVDANGGWSPEEFRAIAPDLRGAGIELVEQPLAPVAAKSASLRLLREETGLRIALDESLADEATALRLIDDGACDAVVLKPALLGLASSARIARAARSAGIDVVVTGCFESGAGYAAALEFAAAFGAREAAHGLATALAVTDDPVRGVPQPERGTVNLPPAGVLPRLACGMAGA